MKRILACLLAVMMLATPLKAFADTAEVETEPEVETEAVEEAELPPLTYDYDELVVGTTMPMYGTFFTSMWGNGSSDIDVRNLLHGYNLVEWNGEEGGFMMNPTVVSNTNVTENAAGDHTYAITLFNDLRYSDGSRVTAWDYAFSMLLRMDPEIEKLGGTPRDFSFLTGYQNYINSRTRFVTQMDGNGWNVNWDDDNLQIPTFAGIRVINDTRLNITISNTVLPFFYELGLLDCNPYPMAVLAPDCELDDDGDGVMIRGKFNAEVLESTIFGENGYLVNPQVTSGPYRLVSWDGKDAIFELNENYVGDANGIRPTIRRVVYRLVNPETMFDELMDCKYALITRTAAASQIQEGMARISEDPRYTTANYPRSGLSFIGFNRENAIFDSEVLRKAIASAIDKDSFVDEAVSNFGLRVDGYYGLGQWMYQLMNGTIAFPAEEPEAGAPAADVKAYEDEIAAWEALVEEMEALPRYEYDTEEAVRLLEQDGWTLNRDGQAFNPEEDDVRCKQIAGQIVPLELKLVYGQGTAVAEALNQLPEQLDAVGIGLTVEGKANLLEQYYGQEEKDYDLIFLASNFDLLFNPAPMFEPDGAYNYSGSGEKKLYDLAEAMNETEPGELLEYCQKWMAFQKEFIEEEPLIPMYSNIYFDFYPLVLQDYTIGEYSSWANAIIPAFMDDIPEEEPVEEEEDLFLD